MTTPLTPAANKLPANVNIPSDTEDADSDSLRAFVQVLIDGIKWVTDIADVLFSGGNLTPGGDVHLNQNSVSGFLFELNQQQFTADGDIITSRWTQWQQRCVVGATTGTTTHIPDGRLVYFSASGMGSANWRIDDAGNTAKIGSHITFYNASNPTCTVQAPGGGTLAVIGNGGANPLWVRCVKVASNAWVALPGGAA